MDLSKHTNLWRVVLLVGATTATGCVAPQTYTPTIWHRMGIPQASVAIRDSVVNRNGNFPGLEKKPPVLSLADPRNLEEGKPEVVKTAAEIKQDQDLKKQKIKAIKFLADVNCGCYDKDEKVEKAFLDALEDCDPDVRLAAVEGLTKTAENCKSCKNQCEPTCLTPKVHKKIAEMALEMEGCCPKEPDADVRKAAKALFCKCPPPAEPIDPEVIPTPEAKPLPKRAKLPTEGDDSDAEEIRAIEADSVGFRLSDATSSRTQTASFRTAISADRSSRQANAAKKSGKLLESKVVAYRRSLGELLVAMPNTFELRQGWTLVVVDENGNHSLGEISDLGGRRVLLSLDSPLALQDVDSGSAVRVGLIAK